MCHFVSHRAVPSHKKAPTKVGVEILSRKTVLFANALEFVLELLHAPCGIDEALLTGISRMAVGGHIADDHEVINPVDFLGFGALHGGVGQKLFAGGNIHEADRIGFGMTLFFHKFLALTGFVARGGFANDINATMATDDLAVRMAVLKRFE